MDGALLWDMALSLLPMKIISHRNAYLPCIHAHDALALTQLQVKHVKVLGSCSQFRKPIATQFTHK